MIRMGGMAHGGEAVGRRNGKVVFVEGALPGELVEVETIQDRGSYERGRLVRIVESSPRRVEPPCPHFGVCGGCRWQFADYPAQLEWKTEIVRSQLVHIGGLESEVRPTRAVGPAYHYRNRMDFRVEAGRLALFASRSRTLVPLDLCLLPVEVLSEAVRTAPRLEDVRRVTLRAGVNTDTALAILEGRPARGIDWAIPTSALDGAVVYEEVAGRRFRISGRSFFQVNTWGAEQLVGVVREAADLRPGDHLLDAYAGVGLFSATVGAEAGLVVAVESDPKTVEDLLANTDAEVIEADAAVALRRLDTRIDVAIVDPPRTGLGADVVEGLLRVGPRVIVSVSCDPASFARDAARLVRGGYRLEWVQPLDLFPQTPHVETVARFVGP